MFRFDLGPLLKGQRRITKLKSAYNSLIIGPRGLQCETNPKEIMGWESSDVFRFDLWPLFQGQTEEAKLRSAYNLLIIGKCCLSSKPWQLSVLRWIHLAFGHRCVLGLVSILLFKCFGLFYFYKGMYTG